MPRRDRLFLADCNTKCNHPLRNQKQIKIFFEGFHFFLRTNKLLTNSAKVARMTVHINPNIKTSPGFFLHRIKENIQQITVNTPKIILIVIVSLLLFIMCFPQSSFEFFNKWLFTAGRFAADIIQKYHHSAENHTIRYAVCHFHRSMVSLEFLKQ